MRQYSLPMTLHPGSTDIGSQRGPARSTSVAFPASTSRTLVPSQRPTRVTSHNEKQHLPLNNVISYTGMPPLPSHALPELPPKIRPTTSVPPRSGAVTQDYESWILPQQQQEQQQRMFKDLARQLHVYAVFFRVLVCLWSFTASFLLGLCVSGLLLGPFFSQYLTPLSPFKPWLQLILLLGTNSPIPGPESEQHPMIPNSH
ncbi:uncharacterized protein V1516DRAFT_667313 [Lipomyces oligophaga]|uniref:uncharacterized protein n=1 Tax=Lipomyces oligophaga TaxID=45792 RepID=UPI0034CD3C8D